MTAIAQGDQIGWLVATTGGAWKKVMNIRFVRIARPPAFDALELITSQDALSNFAPTSFDRVRHDDLALVQTAGTQAARGMATDCPDGRAFPSRGLANRPGTVMPLLKELYQRLRPHTDWTEIETDFGGNVRASLNFTVGDGKNPQFLFSSGQRRAAGLAFLLAIHLSRPWSNLQSLLLDDPVQHIDDYRALNLVEVLSGIRRLGRQVIVAVEDPALADLICRRLRSSATDEGRRYDLSVDVSGSARIERESVLSPLPLHVLELSEAS